MEKLRAQKLIAVVKTLAKPNGMTIDQVARVVLKEYLAEDADKISAMLDDSVEKNMLHKSESCYFPISASPILMSSSHRKKSSNSCRSLRRVGSKEANVRNKTKGRESAAKKSSKKREQHSRMLASLLAAVKKEITGKKPMRLHRISETSWVRIKVE